MALRYEYTLKLVLRLPALAGAALLRAGHVYEPCTVVGTMICFLLCHHAWTRRRLDFEVSGVEPAAINSKARLPAAVLRRRHGCWRSRSLVVAHAPHDVHAIVA